MQMYLQMYLQFFKDKNLLVFSKYLKWKRTILSVRFYLKSTEISTTFSNRNFVCLTKRNNKLIQLQQLRDGGAFNFVSSYPITRTEWCWIYGKNWKMTRIQIIWDKNPLFNEFNIHMSTNRKSTFTLVCDKQKTIKFE